MVYNILSCSGFGEVGIFDIGGACMKARLGIVFLFFLIAVVRKWGGEEIGFDFSFVFGLVGGLAGYLILITLTGSLKVAFVVGIVASLIFGYGAGFVFGGGDEY